MTDNKKNTGGQQNTGINDSLLYFVLVALHYAVMSDNRNAIQILCDQKNADVSSINGEGQTPQQIAVGKKKVWAIEFLQREADVRSGRSSTMRQYFKHSIVIDLTYFRISEMIVFYFLAFSTKCYCGYSWYVHWGYRICRNVCKQYSLVSSLSFTDYVLNWPDSPVTVQ